MCKRTWGFEWPVKLWNDLSPVCRSWFLARRLLCVIFMFCSMDDVLHRKSTRSAMVSDLVKPIRNPHHWTQLDARWEIHNSVHRYFREISIDTASSFKFLNKFTSNVDFSLSFRIIALSTTEKHHFCAECLQYALKEAHESIYTSPWLHSINGKAFPNCSNPHWQSMVIKQFVGGLEVCHQFTWTAHSYNECCLPPIASKTSDGK